MDYKTKCLLAFALALRLVLMPVTLHGDLIFIHYFPYFLSYKGVWDIYGYFGDHYLAHSGFTYYPPLIYYVMAFFQWAFHWINPGFDIFMEYVHKFTYYFDAGRDQMHDYLEPFTVRQIFQYVFFMKLPYLFADAATAFVIVKFCTKLVISRRLLLLWLFHPVLIFSAYIFGQYRNITALLIWWFIYLVSLNRKGLASLMLGLLCLIDSFPLLLVLPVILILGVGLKERLRLAAIIVLPAALILIPLCLHSKGYVLNCYYSPTVIKMSTQSIFLHYPTVVGAVCKALFTVIYIAILGHLYFFRININNTQTRAKFLCYVCLMVLLAVYATSTTHVHYFMWALPFFVIVQSEKEPWNRLLSWIFILLLFCFNLDHSSVNLGLLAPLKNNALEMMPSLHTVMNRYLPWGKVIASSRLLFSVMCIYFSFKLYRNRVNPIRIKQTGRENCVETS